jgi:hypothetical protein
MSAHRTHPPRVDHVSVFILMPKAMRDALKARVRDERRRKPGTYITLATVMRSLLAQGLEGDSR